MHLPERRLRQVAGPTKLGSHVPAAALAARWAPPAAAGDPQALSGGCPPGELRPLAQRCAAPGPGPRNGLESLQSARRARVPQTGNLQSYRGMRRWRLPFCIAVRKGETKHLGDAAPAPRACWAECRLRRRRSRCCAAPRAPPPAAAAALLRPPPAWAQGRRPGAADPSAASGRKCGRRRRRRPLRQEPQRRTMLFV